MSALLDWHALETLLGVSAMATGLGAIVSFVLLLARVAELNRDGDRRVPRFRGNLLFVWPPVVFDWLAAVIDRSKGSDYYKWELRLARACRLLLAAFYLLWAMGFAMMAIVMVMQDPYP